MKKLTWEEATTPIEQYRDPTPLCPGGSSPEFQAKVEAFLADTEKFPNIEGIIFFANVDLWSSHLGETSVVCYGKGYTITDIDAVRIDPMKFHLGDLPSVRKYPQWYITREEYLATHPAGKEEKHANI